jgi:hypothetical protein
MASVRADSPTRPWAQNAPYYRNSATYNHTVRLLLCAVGGAGPRHMPRRFFLPRETGNLR